MTAWGWGAYKSPEREGHGARRVAFGLRISKAGLLYIVITLLLGFSAVNTGNNLLFLVVSGLLAFMSMTGLAGLLNLHKLTPQLLPASDVFAGTPAAFRLIVHNGKRRMPSYLIRVDYPGASGATLKVVPSAGAAETSMELCLPQRGRCRVDKIKISSVFPVDFFMRYWIVDPGVELVVLPRLLSGPVAGEGGQNRQTGTGSHWSRGHEGELERIAQYSGRESLRTIHWKLSARADDLMVKEFGGRLSSPVMIDPRQIEGRTMEERISRAAWLVRCLTPVRPVGLSLDGRIYPAGTGARHCLLLLTELALYDPA